VESLYFPKKMQPEGCFLLVPDSDILHHIERKKCLNNSILKTIYQPFIAALLFGEVKGFKVTSKNEID